jgi:GNAT superfamily N-acetyltransferase
MQVRPATPDDARAIATVHVRAWQAGYRGIIDDARLDALSVDEHEARWRGYLTDPSNPIRTRVTPGVEGFVSIIARARDDDLDDTIAEIPAVYVDPAHWGTGVARALMAAALDELRRTTGAGAVVLWVLEQNARARAFYAAQGFTPDGARKPSPAGPPEIRLRAPLVSARARGA